MNEVVFLLLYLIALSLPGLSLFCVTRIKTNPLLFSISISYALLALAFVLANHYAIAAQTLFWLIVLLLLVTATILARVLANTSFAELKELPQPILIITALSALYQVTVGSFNEVPADLYEHLGRYQTALRDIQQNSLGDALTWQQLFTQKAGVYYYLLAMLGNASDITATMLVAVVDFANRTLFLLAVYFFTLSIFKHHKKVAALAVVFTALHMGINVFSYIRYYTLAPSMLNMIIYMTAVLLFMAVLAQPLRRKSVCFYLAIIALTSAAASIHLQEALFIGVMISLIAVWGMISQIKAVPFNFHLDKPQALSIALVATVCFVGLYVYSHLNLPRAANLNWRLWEFGAGVGLLPDITTLNLKFQFSRVVTLWGMLVYLLFFIHIQRYRHNVFIIAAMLSPALTILNPFFVDVFVRHYNSTTLWRLCYLIPIHLVAADLFIYYLNKLRAPNTASKLLGGTIVVAIMGLLLPYKIGWQGIHYSRFPTLIATDEKLGYAHYQDLIDYLTSLQPSQTILTDPVTGYLISATTAHQSPRRKFFRNRHFNEFVFSDYSDNPLDRYAGHLFIINQRPNHPSTIGRLAQHWGESQWQQSRDDYSQALLAHIAARPTVFKALWHNNNISVYRIE